MCVCDYEIKSSIYEILLEEKKISICTNGFLLENNLMHLYSSFQYNVLNGFTTYHHVIEA